MIRERCTETYIRKLKPEAKPYSVWCSEVPGWGCRFSGRTGRKVIVVQGLPAGRTKRKIITSGTFNTMKCPVARQKAIEALEALSRKCQSRRR